MRELVDFEGRAVGDQQQLCAALRQVCRDRVEPDVFADREAQAGVPELHRLRQRPGLEDALLIEDAIVRQLVFEAQFRASVRDQCNSVVQTSPFFPRKRHHDAGDAGGRAFALQFAERVRDGLEQRGTQHEILGRVPDQNELGKDDKVGALSGRLITRAPHERRVSAHISYGGVDLRERNRQRHG